jgi:hypothetical protein
MSCVIRRCNYPAESEHKDLQEVQKGRSPRDIVNVKLGVTHLLRQVKAEKGLKRE